MDFILYSGGDFELLFTIEPNKLNLLKIIEKKINNYFKKKLEVSKYEIIKHKYPLLITIIGKVVHKEKRVYLKNKDGSKIYISKKGYDPFKN